MKVLFCLLFVFVFFACSYAQNCDLQGGFSCSGGNILGIDFGDDEDDDFFEYFRSDGQEGSNDFCTIQQQGTYDIDGADISVEFNIDDDECVISGDGDDCDCVDSLQFSISSNCVTVTGPDGETCTPAASKNFNCLYFY